MKTRLTSMPDQKESGTQDSHENSDVPVTAAGQRSCPLADAAEHLQGPTCVLDKRCKRDALRSAFAADKEVVNEHARWWNSELKSQVEASRSSAVGGVEAAISAWVADDCNRVLGQVLSEQEGVARAYLVREAKVKELD